MKPVTIMLVAGEASGDLLGAELVRALRVEFAEADAEFDNSPQPLHASLAPRFFGAGGTRMREAGVDIAVDMAGHGVIGLSDVFKKYFYFRRCFKKLLRLALERQPEAIVGVDFSGFNLRFASAIRRHVRGRRPAFNNWNPRLIQFVSPQVWASRPGRVRRMQRDLDLVLSIFPFEKNWYAEHAPKLRVEFVGHPIVDRYCLADTAYVCEPKSETPTIAVLPGSRIAELKRHLPPMHDAAHRVAERVVARFRVVLPTASLADLARKFDWPANTEILCADVAAVLPGATIAIASTGTVTMECAWFGVPTITMYITSGVTYQIARRVVTVRHLAMPNLLAGETIFPELIQHAATGENIAAEALALLNASQRQLEIRKKLRAIMASLGPPEAGRRAAHAIASLVGEHR